MHYHQIWLNVSFVKKKTFPFKVFRQPRSITDIYQLFLHKNEPNQNISQIHGTLSLQAHSPQPPGLRGALAHTTSTVTSQSNHKRWGESWHPACLGAPSWVSAHLAKAPGAQHGASVTSLEEGLNTGFLVWVTNCCKSTGFSWVTCCSARMELHHILQSSAAWSSQHWAPWCAGTAAVGPPCKLRRPRALVQALANDHFYSLNVQTVLDSNLAHASQHSPQSQLAVDWIVALG